MPAEVPFLGESTMSVGLGFVVRSGVLGFERGELDGEWALLMCMGVPQASESCGRECVCVKSACGG